MVKEDEERAHRGPDSLEGNRAHNTRRQSAAGCGVLTLSWLLGTHMHSSTKRI